MNKNTFLLVFMLVSLECFSQLTLVKNLSTSEVPAVKTISGNAIYNNKAYYSGKVTTTSTPLYSTDGTSAGTTLVKELGVNYPANAFTPSELALFVKTSTKLFFLKSQTNDDLSLRTTEIWVTDGTSANTTMIASKATSGSSYPFLINNNESFGDLNAASENFVDDKLIFSGYNPDLPTVTSTNMILYVSDGTSGGTIPLLSASGEKIFTTSIGRKLNGKYYFSGRTTLDLNNGTRLWVTDGTQSGTHIVNTSQTDPTYFVDGTLSSAINGKILFWGGNSATGYEIWETNGTDAGTVLFKEYVAGSNDSQPNYGNALNFFHDGNKVYFLLQLDNATPNFQLWSTDGTLSNTFKIIDLNTLNDLPEDVSKGNGKFYFRTRGKKIFVSDGTSSGTYYVKTINKAAIPYIKTYKESLFYDDYDVPTISNNELWRCDGTLTNTTRIFDIYPGTLTSTISNSSNPRDFFVLGDDLFFVANIAGGAKLYKFKGDFTFNGTTSTSWNTGTNWNATIAPGINDLATIPMGQTVDVNTNGFTKNANISGNINLVSGNLNLFGTMTLANSAKITLNANNLNLKGINSSIVGNETNYVVTNGTGTVTVENLDTSRGTISLPIGTATNYNPVSFSNSGTSDTFSVRVSDGITGTTNGAVNTTWEISEATIGGSNVNLNLGWNQAQENGTFDRNTAKIGHFVSGNWTEETSGAISGSNPYTLSGTGISSFSPFSVMNFSALSVSDFNESKLAIYPNPSNGEFTIQVSDSFVGGKATIYNLLGQKIQEFKVNQNSQNHNLNKGVYLVELAKDGKKEAKKVIVN